jgi:WD40 repeat protein
MSRAPIAGLVLLVLAFVAPPAPGQPSKGRTDAIGDPLPPGALLRLGTIRWRTGTSHRGNASLLSPDGRSVFVGGDHGEIRVIDLDTGVLLRVLRGGEEGINALAISSDGKLLASAGYEKAFLWDVESGKQIRPLKVRSVSVMTFSPDCKKLITGGEDHERSVRVLDVASGKEELRMLWHQRRVIYVRCGADNKTLVSCSWDNNVRVTDLSTGEAVHTFQEKYAHDTAVALSPDGKTLAISERHYQQKQPRTFHRLRLIDVADGKQRQIVQHGTQSISGLTFSPDSKSLVAWSDKDSQVFDVATGKPQRQLAGVYGRHFTPDGHHLVSIGSVIRVWEFEGGKELHPPDGPLNAADSLAFAPDGATIAASAYSDRGVIHLWDTASGKLKGVLRGHESYIRAVQFAPDGRLISGGGDSTLRVWDTGAGKEAFQFKLHEPRAGEKPLQVVEMQVAADGRTLAAAAVGFEGLGSKETVRMFAWNLANRKTIAFREHAGSFADWPAFSADAKAFLARDDKGLVVKDLLDGKERLRLQPAPQPGGEGVLNSDVLDHPFIFAPDGRVVAVHASRQRNEGPRYWRDRYALALFDLSTGKEMHRIGLDRWLARAAFSPDGKRVVAADGPGVRIWDAATGKRLWECPELDSRVTALAFNAAGDRLATGLENTTILIWDVGSTK